MANNFIHYHLKSRIYSSMIRIVDFRNDLFEQILWDHLSVATKEFA